MFRKALWPSDGNTDSIIHKVSEGCGLAVFDDDTIDESIIAKWNTRSSGLPPATDLEWAERIIKAVDEARHNSDSRDTAEIAAGMALLNAVALIRQEGKLS